MKKVGQWGHDSAREASDQGLDETAKYCRHQQQCRNRVDGSSGVCQRPGKSRSSAALSIISRTGLGKAKHIENQYLLLQEAVRNNKLTVEKISSETNSSDLGTKRLTVDEARELLLRMRLWIRVRVTNLVRTGRR